MKPETGLPDGGFSLIKRLKRPDCKLDLVGANPSTPSLGQGVPAHTLHPRPVIAALASVTRVLVSVAEAQVFNPVVPAVLVNVVDLHALRDFTIVIDPYRTVKQDMCTLEGDMHHFCGRVKATSFAASKLLVEARIATRQPEQVAVFITKPG